MDYDIGPGGNLREDHARTLTGRSSRRLIASLTHVMALCLEGNLVVIANQKA